MIKTKVAFLEGRPLSSQSEQSEKFSKSPDWSGKSRPSKKNRLIMELNYFREQLSMTCAKHHVGLNG